MDLDAFSDLFLKRAAELGAAKPLPEEITKAYSSYRRLVRFAASDGTLEFVVDKKGHLEFVFNPHSSKWNRD